MPGFPIVCGDGETPIAKSAAGAAIVSVAPTEWTRVPSWPMIVIGVVAAAAPGATVSVSVEVDVVELGENIAVTPLGRPPAERETWPVRPFFGETVTV